MRTCFASPAPYPSAPRAERALQQGFTLIEVMIAIALMALISLLSWKGLEQVSTARDWLGDETADQAVILRTMGQIERDLNRAYLGVMPSVIASPPGQAGEPTTTGPHASLLPPGIAVTQSAGAVLINLIRATPDNGLWQRVMWRLRPDGLWRYSGAPASSYPLPEPDQGVLIMPEATTLAVRAWLSGQGWVDPLQPAAARATGLEIIIERQRRDRQERFTRIVVLP